MLSPFDDYPIHQSSLPLAHAGGGHPDHYDRFWFNGYTEDLYFGVAMAVYPNRGVIDAAFSVVHEGVQRSVFASGRLPLDRTLTRIGPLSIEITEPLRANRIRVSAPDHHLVADLTYRSRTPSFEEPRQTSYAGTRLAMDVTRLTSLGTWTGVLEVAGRRVGFDRPAYGTKDRSWGIRPVGLPAPAAPEPRAPQVFFLWAPLNFADSCLHYMVFENSRGEPWNETAVVLPVVGADDPVYGVDADLERPRIRHRVDWQPGLRRSRGARLEVRRADGTPETVSLRPLLTFRMKGIGYMHPTWAHGRWHDELAVGGEAAEVGALDTLSPECIHVQQVMEATWGDRRGLGVLEQLVIGPHEPSGFSDVLDGAPGG